MIGKIFEQASIDAGIQSTVLPEIDAVGGADVIRKVANRHADLAATYPHAAKWALEGKLVYEGESKPDLRALAFIDRPCWVVMAVARDTGIESLRDIRNKKFPLKLIITAEGGLIGDIERACFSLHGTAIEDVKSWGGELFEIFKNFDQSQVGPYFKNGSANMMVTHGEPFLRSWQEASVWRDLRFLPIDRDVAEQVSKKFGVIQDNIPAGTFRGQSEDTLSITYPGWVIICRKDLPDEVAFNLTRTLDGHSKLFVRAPDRFCFNGNHACRDTGIPLHPGAERYFRERGYLE